MRHRLEFFDGPAERLPGRSVGYGGVQRRLRHPDNGGPDTGSEEVERPYRQPESAVALAQDLLLGDKATIQLQPTDRMRRKEVHRRSAKPFRIALDDEGGDALCSCAGRGPGKDRVDVCIRRVRDKDLDPGQPEPLAIGLGAQGKGASIRARAWFGQRDRRDLASDSGGEPSQLVAVRHDWRAPPSMTMPWPLMPRATSEHR